MSYRRVNQALAAYTACWVAIVVLLAAIGGVL